jgi:hypothetical protein
LAVGGCNVTPLPSSGIYFGTEQNVSDAHENEKQVRNNKRALVPLGEQAMSLIAQDHEGHRDKRSIPSNNSDGNQHQRNAKEHPPDDVTQGPVFRGEGRRHAGVPQVSPTIVPFSGPREKPRATGAPIHLQRLAGQ